MTSRRVSPTAARLTRRVGLLLAGPAAAGVLIAAAALGDQPFDGVARTGVQALALAPALLVQCHPNANRFGLADSVLLGAVAALVACVVSVCGLVAGAGVTLLLVLAVQTGVLTAANEISGVISLLVVLRSRPRTT